MSGITVFEYDLKPEAIARTRQLMDANVREALVENFEHLIPAIELPDPDDRHVVAAAMHAGAELIITFNGKDFPAAELQKYNVSAQHPDDFIFDLFDLNAAKVLQAASRHRRSMKMALEGRVLITNTDRASSRLSIVPARL
jgi:hypothetical protein